MTVSALGPSWPLLALLMIVFVFERPRLAVVMAWQ